MKTDKEKTDDYLKSEQDKGRFLFRNNVGKWRNKEGAWVAYGVGGEGGADYIGFSKITVTEDMIGKVLPIFTAIEVKRDPKDLPKEHQLDFLKGISDHNGFAYVKFLTE